MNPYYEDLSITVYNKSCTSMDELPDESIQCCVTSPPYWGLRKYSGNQDLLWGNHNGCEHEWGKVTRNIAGGGFSGKSTLVGFSSPDVKGRQMNGDNQTYYNTCSLCGAWRGSYGLEPTPELYVAHSIEILREIRRVLRKDGVCFWNIGDSYYGSGKGIGSDHGKAVFTDNDIVKTKTQSDVLKPKDLCLIPFRVAIAAQEDGWWVRSVIIWNKNNPMPESVKDRPTESHEYILLLTKSANYYWNQEAILEPIAESTIGRGPVAFGGSKGRQYNPDESDPNFRNGNEQWGRVYDYQKSSRKMADADKSIGGNGSGFKGHSGNYDANGNLLGNPLGRNCRSVWTFSTHPYKEAHFATFPEELPERCIKAGSKEGDIVLEPFAGSGTTLWVSKRLGRKAVGYELSSEYCELIVNRNRQQVLV